MRTPSRINALMSRAQQRLAAAQQRYDLASLEAKARQYEEWAQNTERRSNDGKLPGREVAPRLPGPGAPGDDPGSPERRRAAERIARWRRRRATRKERKAA